MIVIVKVIVRKLFIFSFVEVTWKLEAARHLIKLERAFPLPLLSHGGKEEGKRTFLSLFFFFMKEALRHPSSFYNFFFPLYSGL